MYVVYILAQRKRFVKKPKSAESQAFYHFFRWRFFEDFVFSWRLREFFTFQNCTKLRLKIYIYFLKIKNVAEFQCFFHQPFSKCYLFAYFCKRNILFIIYISQHFTSPFPPFWKSNFQQNITKNVVHNAQKIFRFFYILHIWFFCFFSVITPPNRRRSPW